ncbi:DUF294 nucleotidyltransferase-like domain-containing protein [Zhouia sp. PK063]|uniref:DUF294 nucleotidyltransferase-like domain-containing protein n=1 Tax=Zhouia sp. PK063 TaxID=3373602 RepID=UPI0037A57886
MKNTIAERIADYLKRYPPFDLLQKNDLLEITLHVEVLYFEKNKIIFQQQEKCKPYFYVVHKGAVILERLENEHTDTLDKCDEGDLFGLRPLFAQENYLMTAKTDEESIIYAIPIAQFKPLVERNPAVGNFLIQSFASNARNPYSKEHRGKLYTDLEIEVKSSTELFELQPVKYIKKIVTVNEDATAQDVALLMTKHRIGSVLIVKNETPLGIITDKDLRKKIVTGNFPIQTSVANIMSHPVLCYTKNITTAQAQIAMLKHSIGHLVITKDGTPNSKVKGIISEHDIVVSQGNNPSVLVKAIQRAQRSKELKRIHNKITFLLKGYIKQNIPLTHTSKIIFELYDATIKRIIDISLAEMPEPPVNFAWMSLGSQGRKEQLLHTDQDSAIVFENVNDNELEEVRSYFIDLANRVTKRLNNIGFEYCPADMMANNPRYCLSLNEWKEQFTTWVTVAGDDELLLCSIFFDYDITYGDANLTNTLADHIFEITKTYPAFLSKLASVTLSSPSPIGFFRQFLVEEDGEYKDLFDIKKRALMPLTDAARILILSHHVKNINNTSDRFEKLATLEPENKELYLACSYSARALLKFRTRHGLTHNNGGRFIALAELTKEEKMKLKRCFKSVRNVQELIKLRFKLSTQLL